MSGSSMLRTGETRLRRFFDATAALVQLPRWSYKGDTFTPGELLEGLALAESAGNPKARRYEPHQDRPGRPDTSRDPDVLAQDDGAKEDDASYGLLQVMGYTLKDQLHLERPSRLNFEILFRPTWGIASGVDVLLVNLRAAYVAHPTEAPDVHMVRALCRYNGGTSGDSIDPATKDLRRREYVDRVHEHAKAVQLDRRASAWREFA